MKLFVIICHLKDGNTIIATASDIEKATNIACMFVEGKRTLKVDIISASDKNNA